MFKTRRKIREEGIKEGIELVLDILKTEDKGIAAHAINCLYDPTMVSINKEYFPLSDVLDEWCEQNNFKIDDLWTKYPLLWKDEEIK